MVTEILPIGVGALSSAAIPTQRPGQLRARRSGNTEHPEPSRRSQRFETFSPMIASERIGNQRDPFSICQPIQFDRPILCPVVDRFMHTPLF